MLKYALNFTYLIIFTILLLGCNSEVDEYYYVSYNANNNYERFVIKKIIYDDNFRKELSYYFRINGELSSFNSSYFKPRKTGLEKSAKNNGLTIFKPYLSTQNKTAIHFLYQDERTNLMASTTFKYLGQEDIVIHGVTYKNTYKFIKKLGQHNAVVSYVYYDSDFISVLEEFIEGGRPYYRLERIDSVLNFKLD